MKPEDRGRVYRSPDWCTVVNPYFSRDEVDRALGEPSGDEVVIASPQRRAGVLALAPDEDCPRGIARDLARLDR